MSGINIYVFHSTFSEVNKIHPCFILTPQITYLWISENTSPSILLFLSEHLICGKLAFQLLFTNLILVWAKHSITSLGIYSGKADQSFLSFLILVSWWGKAFFLTVHNSLPLPKKKKKLFNNTIKNPLISARSCWEIDPKYVMLLANGS